jgi:hypothetical protein
VDPQEVLRTFTASLHSGGTLGAIHSSLTYYKEALASKEWSNLSPSNAYQNYMYRKNLVGEIQRLARELNKIPTEEAKILADLSKSKLSYDFRNSISYNNQNSVIGQNPLDRGSAFHGMIGHNDSSVIFDPQRASSVLKVQEDYKAREEAAIRQQVKRIVEGSATRMEPLMASFTDVPLHESINKHRESLHSRHPSNYSLGPRSQNSMQQPIKVPQGQQNLNKPNIRISRRSNSQLSNVVRKYDSNDIDERGEHTL